jgi:hypothetical protein
MGRVALEEQRRSRREPAPGPEAAQLLGGAHRQPGKKVAVASGRGLLHDATR